MKQAGPFVLFLMTALILGAGTVLASESNGTIDATDKYSRICRSADCSEYSTVNWKPTGSTAVTITDSAISGYAWGDEIGWVNFAPTGAGVLVNPSTGALSGYAYSNAGGWINFKPTAVSGGTSVGVSINSSGEFTGWAWASGARGGWMKFDCASANTCVRTDWRPIPNRTGGSSGSGSGPTPGTGGGGTGRSIATPPASGITVAGRAYPLSKVTVLKDGQFALSSIAGPDARFEVTLSGLGSGTYTITVYTEDDAGNRSGLFTVPVSFTAEASTRVGGIFLAPTIGVSKSEVRHGENIAIFGQSVPAALVTISVHSPEEIFVNTVTDEAGAYLYNFDTSKLTYGRHLAKSKAAQQEEISGFGNAVGFNVGDRTTDAEPGGGCSGDVNGDCRVNLTDFSMAAHWYKRPSPPAAIDLNDDGKVDLADLSIMAFHWTG